MMDESFMSVDNIYWSKILEIAAVKNSLSSLYWKAHEPKSQKIIDKPIKNHSHKNIYFR